MANPQSMNARSRHSGEPLASIKSSRRVRHRAARSAHIPVFSSCSFAIPRRAEPRRAMERIDDVKCLEHPLNVGFGGGLHPPNRQWAGIFRCGGIRGGLDPVDKFVRRKSLSRRACSSADIASPSRWRTSANQVGFSVTVLVPTHLISNVGNKMPGDVTTFGSFGTIGSI